MSAASSGGINRATLCQVVQALYQEVDVAPPCERYPIAPLGPVLERLPLRCLEVAPLSGQVAEKMLRQRGVQLEPNALKGCDSEPLAGFLFAGGALGFVFVLKTDPVTRRRFSIAHELGHYLLHFRPRLLAPTEEMDPLLGMTDAFRTTEAEDAEAVGEEARMQQFLQVEREANHFAAELLMPEEVVTTLAARWRFRLTDEALVERLAAELLVSKAAMRLRLRLLESGRSLWD